MENRKFGDWILAARNVDFSDAVRRDQWYVLLHFGILFNVFEVLDDTGFRISG